MRGQAAAASRKYQKGANICFVRRPTVVYVLFGVLGENTRSTEYSGVLVLRECITGSQ
jgi:hypothetical protein